MDVKFTYSAETCFCRNELNTNIQTLIPLKPETDIHGSGNKDTPHSRHAPGIPAVPQRGTEAGLFKAFEAVIQDAVDMQVDAVVHAGDLFDSRNPTLEDLLETMNILFRLKAANIPFFGIVGNHESKQNTQWLDLFEEMGLALRLEKTPRMVGNTAIYGIDSVPKSKIPLYDYSGFGVPVFLSEVFRF